MQVECKNLTDKDCSYTVDATTVEEAKQKMREHMQAVHPEMGEDQKTQAETKIESKFA